MKWLCFFLLSLIITLVLGTKRRISSTHYPIITGQRIIEADPEGSWSTTLIIERAYFGEIPKYAGISVKDEEAVTRMKKELIRDCNIHKFDYNIQINQFVVNEKNYGLIFIPFYVE